MGRFNPRKPNKEILVSHLERCLEKTEAKGKRFSEFAEMVKASQSVDRK